jgi:hypothetical protein
VDIAVIGGSMTYGHNCHDSVLGDLKDCAWPRRLEQLLRTLNPKIVVHNNARPGWGYENWLYDWSLRSHHPDLYIIDLAVNAQSFAKSPLQLQQVLDVFLHTLLRRKQTMNNASYAILFLETFRTCSIHVDDCDKHCVFEEQGQMHSNLTNLSYSWCNGWWSIQDFETPVLRHYGIPIASYRDAVWPDLANPTRLLPCFWNGMSHSDAIAHILAADVVMYAMHRLMSYKPGNSICDVESMNPVPFHQNLVIPQYCSDSAYPYGTKLSSITNPENFLPISSYCWNFTEDRPGKHGWIATASSVTNKTNQPNNYLAFAINTSSTPRLEITYLQSYENYGRVQLFIGRQDFNKTRIGEALGSYELSGFSGEHFSVPKTTVFVRNGSVVSPMSSHDFHILPNSVTNGTFVVALVLLIETPTSKFKLLEINSC